MSPTVGLIVNPVAGRDIRRLTGGASVSSNYAKRRTAACVLEGVTMADDAEVLVMPDNAGLADRIVDGAPEDLTVDLLDMTVTASGEDARNAAKRFSDAADAVVVLGGDGTNRDVAHGIGDVPVVSISTGTNNVVPTAVDGTVAGIATGLIASRAVSADETTVRHGTVEAVVADGSGERRIRGLATLGLLDQQFVGTRAILDPEDVIGGVVSRASSNEIGLSGIAGGLAACRPDDPGGVGFRLGTTSEPQQEVHAVTVPGVLSRIPIEEYRVLDDGEVFAFDVATAVVSADGERELEVRDADVRLQPVSDGPRFVQIDAVVERAAKKELFRIE
ncbi:NAD(+)/NADH kinase [Haladaptatus caseinilyticus]|uniref:NAD(+)/NADH kinase n=1 Tax=Haladaptatus caseinilyticus TaxID=2993314 RepID=UPI00224B5D4A|nr:NAD(+)/NADH kinase [Haladaptatus caseinilyticus]